MSIDEMLIELYARYHEQGKDTTFAAWLEATAYALWEDDFLTHESICSNCYELDRINDDGMCRRCAAKVFPIDGQESSQP